MHSRWCGFVVTACLLIAATTALHSQSGDRFEIVVSKNVMVAMRDGVRLATDIYRPAQNGVPVEDNSTGWGGAVDRPRSEPSRSSSRCLWWWPTVLRPWLCRVGYS